MNFFFLYPQFLWAFTLLAIPVAIHLFNFRKYKEIHFPNTLFLRTIKEQSKSANQLKNLIILLLRLLAFSFLILAFAMPFTQRGEMVSNEGSKLHAFYIDNSFSMNSANEGGRLLEDAKKKVESLVKSMPNTDFFLLTTNDFEGKHRRHLDKKNFLEELNALEESPHSRTLSEVYLRQQSDIGDENADLYWLSDFQKNINDIKKEKIDSLSNLFVIPIEPSVKNNISIDSCWFESPVRKLESPENLMIKVTNHGDKNLQNINLRLSVNNEQKAFAAVNLKAKASEIVKLSYSLSAPGLIKGKIDIDDSPILFDNSFYFSYDIRKKTNIVQIIDKSENKAFQKLFKNDSSVVFEKKNIGQLDYSSLSENDLIILDELENYSSGLVQELQKFVQNGGNLLFIPSSQKEGLDLFTNTLQIDALGNYDTSSVSLSRFNTESEFFNNVFSKKELPENEKLNLPTIKGHFKINANYINGKEIILSLQNNDPYLTRYKKGSSAVYVLSSPLNTKTGFAQHWLFPIAMYRLIFTSISSDILYQNIHQNLQFPIKAKQNSGAAVFTMTNGKNEFALNLSKTGDKPFLFCSNSIDDAGIFDIQKDKKTINSIALNYSRKESSMDFMSEDELKSMFGESKNVHIISTSEIKAAASGTDILNKQEYWKHFIIGALAMLLAEVLVIRLWKS